MAIGGQCRWNANQIIGYIYISMRRFLISLWQIHANSTCVQFCPPMLISYVVFTLGVTSIAKVSRVGWWMGHYQSATPKRHYGYANSPVIHRIDRGKLQGWKDRGVRKVVTAEKYKDKGGKNRYKGTTSLRSTEILEAMFAKCFSCYFDFSYKGTHGILDLFSNSMDNLMT